MPGPLYEKTGHSSSPVQACRLLLARQRHACPHMSGQGTTWLRRFRPARASRPGCPAPRAGCARYRLPRQRMASVANRIAGKSRWRVRENPAIPARQEHAFEIPSTGRPESRNRAEIPPRHSFSGRQWEWLAETGSTGTASTWECLSFSLRFIRSPNVFDPEPTPAGVRYSPIRPAASGGSVGCRSAGLPWWAFSRPRTARTFPRRGGIPSRPATS